MTTLAILQARMTSTRLPGKVMAEINGFPMIHWQISRILNTSKIDKLVVATSIDSSDNILYSYLISRGIEVHRGSLHDVHSRFLRIILENAEFENIVRLTGDCPLVMPSMLDEMIKEFEKSNYDYYTNCNPPTYPDGLDIEIFSRAAFLALSKNELNQSEKEHVTLGFRKNQDLFQLGNKRNQVDESDMRWTVDYREDLDFVRGIFEAFKSREDKFGYDEVRQLLLKNPLLAPQLSGSLRNIALTLEGGNEIE